MEFQRVFYTWRICLSLLFTVLEVTQVHRSGWQDDVFLRKAQLSISALNTDISMYIYTGIHTYIHIYIFSSYILLDPFLVQWKDQDKLPVFIVRNKQNSQTECVTNCIVSEYWIKITSFSQGCKTWSLALREKRRFRVCENGVLREGIWV